MMDDPALEYHLDQKPDYPCDICGEYNRLHEVDGKLYCDNCFGYILDRIWDDEFDFHEEENIPF